MSSSNGSSGDSSPTNNSNNLFGIGSDASGNGHSHASDASGNGHSHESSGSSSNESSQSDSSSNSQSGASSSSLPDASANVLDIDCSFVDITIAHVINTVITDGSGYEIVNKTGADVSGSAVTQVTFDTTMPEVYDPQIHQKLSEVIEIYNDEAEASGQTELLLNEIEGYAAEIKCSDFHGKGSIDDYTALFQAASQIATESKQMELNVDIEGFNEFAQAADDLSALFSGFITKLQNVNIITDVTFLTAIASALKKIVNLSNIFGKFKETILATSTIQIPKTAHDTAVIIEGVMGEINCAMNYINYFVSPTDASLNGAQLSAAELNIIAQSVRTIETWNILCEQGVSIAMSTDPAVVYMQQASAELHQTTNNLKTATNTLRAKMAAFHFTC